MMKATRWLGAALALGLCGSAWAGGSRLDALNTWLLHLKQALSDSAVSGQYQRHRSLTVVAAVRGAKQSVADLDQPAWITQSKARRLENRTERQEFAAAVDLALSGKTADALGKLDAFEKAHPRSLYLADVRQAREKLQTAANP